MGAYLNPTTQDYVQLTGGDLTQDTNPVLSSVLLRLHTRRGSCFWDLAFGSTLHELQHSKMGPAILRQAEDAVRDALQPLVRSRKILKLGVVAELDGAGRISLTIVAQDRGWRPLRFTTFVRV